MSDEQLDAYLRQLIEAHARVARGHDRVAGRRADADGPRLLPPLGRARRAVPQARPARGAHDPDERHADRRRVGCVLQGARLPRRDLDRRPARDPRRLPRDEGRPRHLRQGDAPGSAPARGGGRVERAHDDPRRERGPGRRGLPLPARRVRRALHAVHPDHRARAGGCGRRDRAVVVVARPAALRAGGHRGHRPLGERRAVRALPDRRLRGVGAPRHRRGLRADVRRRARQLVRRAAGAVRALGDLRARARRSSTRATSTRATTSSSPTTCSGTSPTTTCSTWSRRPPSGNSARPSATRCRRSAASATCASPATAAARRTASSRRRTASRGSTTSATATRTSSTTSTSRCA